LYNLILSFLGPNKTAIARNIAVDLLNFVFEETHNKIWLPRCENMKNLEKIMKITKEDKKKKDEIYLTEKYEELSAKHPQRSSPIYEGLNSIKEYITFGTEILGFMVNVIRVGKNSYNSSFSCSFHHLLRCGG
jgi:hypothetical protein